MLIFVAVTFVAFTAPELILVVANNVATVTSPLVALKLPAISSLYSGVTVPTPTLPPVVTTLPIVFVSDALITPEPTNKRLLIEAPPSVKKLPPLVSDVESVGD